MSNNYTLNTEFEAFVQRQVSNGRFQTATDVIYAALRLLKEDEQSLAHLDRALAQGMADMDAGRVYNLDDVRAELTHKYTRLAEAR